MIILDDPWGLVLIAEGCENLIPLTLKWWFSKWNLHVLFGLMNCCDLCRNTGRNLFQKILTVRNETRDTVHWRNPASVDLIIISSLFTRVFTHPFGGWEWDFWTINSMLDQAFASLNSWTYRETCSMRPSQPPKGASKDFHENTSRIIGFVDKVKWSFNKNGSLGSVDFVWECTTPFNWEYLTKEDLF